MKNSTTPSAMQLWRTPVLAVALCAVMSMVASLQAAVVVKANNSDDLNLGTSWVNNAVPGSSDVAQWDSTLADVNNTTNTLGASTNWGGIKVLNPAGAITIGTNTGPTTLTLGNSGIDMSAATVGLTMSNTLALAANSLQTWKVGGAQTLSLAGPYSRGANSVLYYDLAPSATVNIASGTVSNILTYITLNGTDVAGLDSSKNVVSAAMVISNGYLANPLTGLPTSAYIDMVNGATGTAGDVSMGSGSTSYTPRVIRFNTPQPNRNYWLYSSGSRNQYVSSAPTTVLVTTNVGAQDITFNGSYNLWRWPSGGGELVFAQHNPAGTVYVSGATSEQGANNANALTKYGVGRVVWNAGLPQTGPTRILEGEFVLGGTVKGAVSVHPGAKFRCNGYCRSSVTVFGGATVVAGNETGAGTLTATNGLALNDGSKVQFYAPAVPTTNTTGLILVTNGPAITVSGTVTVDILSGTLTPGSYPLIQSAPGFTGGGTFALGIIKPHVTAHLDFGATNLNLVVDSVNQPLTWIKGSDTWNTTSPNWQDTVPNVTTYQELAGLGDSVLFEDTLSGAGPITVMVNTILSPSAVTVNNSAKNYTFSGAGSINGGAALTKAGTGTLTLGTANTFAGGLNINGGTVNFSSLANLGSGVINFGGGILRYNGNTDDISVRTVTFGAGGATINEGGATVTFANAVGNNGVGGFIKAGSGNLTLNGTNRYSGETVIAGGTLTLSTGASIPNSAAIIVNSGTTVDASLLSGITLNGTVSQKLFGNGTVLGGLTVNSGTSVSPLTNGSIGTLTIGNGSLTVSGGTLMMDVSSSSRDLIAIGTGGTLSLSGGTLQLNVTGTLPYGSYTLITYPAGGLSSGPGSAGSLSLTGFAQVGAAATLSDAVDGQIQLVISPSASDVITWAGVGSDWDLSGVANWYLGASTPWAFTNGDYVTFNDIGVGYPSVSLKAAVKPTTITVTSDTTSYAFEDGTGVGGGKLSGLAALTKNGAATLTVNTVNDSSGNVVVNGGTLQVGGHLGSGNITNNADLLFNQSVSRTITGSLNGPGNLTQSGSATLTLAADNPFTGGVTINSGTLQVGNGGATGSLGTTRAITNYGTLALNRSANLTLANPIEGSGALSKSGTGTLTLTGNNTYSGATTVSAGKLIMGNATAHAGNGALLVQAGATNDINGSDITVARLANSNPASATGGRIVNNSGTATNVLTINYDGSGGGDTSIVIADNDGTGGRIRVVKEGTGNQYLRSASTYSGGTIIKAGALQARSQDNAFGTATNVILSGGILDNYSSSLYYTIETTADSGLNTSGNCWFYGPLISPHTITATIAGSGDVTMSWGTASQMTAFTGRMVIQGNAATASHFRWAQATGALNGSSAASWDLEGNTDMTSRNSGYTILLGSLEGASTSDLWGNSTTYIVGDKNTNTTYSGLVGGSGSFVKSGTATLTLNGGYSFSGSTVVSNGTLVLTGWANPTNSSTIAPRAGGVLDVRNMGITITETNELGEVTNTFVQVTGRLDLPGTTNAQVLTGSGTILGSVAAAPNSTINPGDAIGNLTIANALTISGGTVNMEINRTNPGATNDLITAGSITVTGGTLNVTNLGPVLFTGQVFKLFNQAVTGFTTVNMPVADGGVTYVWNNKLATDGTIELVSGGSPVSTTPLNMTYSLSGSSVTLSWPDSYVGWTLQAQTNTVSAGLSNNWVDVAGSANTNKVVLPVNPANGSVFFRLHYLIP